MPCQVMFRKIPKIKRLKIEIYKNMYKNLLLAINFGLPTRQIAETTIHKINNTKITGLQKNASTN